MHRKDFLRKTLIINFHGFMLLRLLMRYSRDEALKALLCMKDLCRDDCILSFCLCSTNRRRPFDAHAGNYCLRCCRQTTKLLTEVNMHLQHFFCCFKLELRSSSNKFAHFTEEFLFALSSMFCPSMMLRKLLFDDGRKQNYIIKLKSSLA